MADHFHLIVVWFYKKEFDQLVLPNSNIYEENLLPWFIATFTTIHTLMVSEQCLQHHWHNHDKALH